MEVRDLHGKASSPTQLGAAVQIDVIEVYLEVVDGARTRKTKAKARAFFREPAGVDIAIERRVDLDETQI
ncbi:hypothetical protein [Sinomonas gamaensis]|uniref:hypothetical protein n=1 Tax=Sinomonas gamaensis TaxID=2565624 RepID=UPI001109C6D7|nr:hypothetical protein [Sinomonas gamaensis]